MAGAAGRSPFAAFGVLAAMTLSRADAIRVTVALWQANQAIGYGILEYPRTVNASVGAWPSGPRPSSVPSLRG